MTGLRPKVMGLKRNSGKKKRKKENKGTQSIGHQGRSTWRGRGYQNIVHFQF